MLTVRFVCLVVSVFMAIFAHRNVIAMKKISKISLLCLAAALLAGGVWAWLVPMCRYSGRDARVYIPADAASEEWRDSLSSALGQGFADKVYASLRLMGEEPRYGSYVINEGTPAFRAARNMAKGRQTPVRVTINNMRLMNDLATRVCRRLEADPRDFLQACDTMLPAMGFAPEQFPAAFLPNTYEYYWNAPACGVVRDLVRWRNKWWEQDSRIDKAKKLGLTPVEVATLASIVEEESAKADELPKIARLYLNRLKRGMPLQADPTVKFAVGDFSLRRILGAHLKTPSAYNTYLAPGLPPGPIRIASQQGIDAVLNAPEHNNLYMCAREDFSGYHRFAETYAEHMRNARAYQAALNKLNIK